MPSSASDLSQRSKDSVLARDLTGVTGTVTSTSTVTTVKQSLRQRTVASSNGHGLWNGKASDDGSDNVSDTSSEANSNIHSVGDYKPYCPSFSVAFKVLFLVRVLAATYSNISDCDEVFNYWEPMHYLQYGSGLETWEYSPVYAIRSWAYILVHALPAEIARLAMSANRLQVFFILRIILGAVSAHCEATLYTAVVEEVDPRIGRYLLFALMTSAGTWIASNAFLPSTFAMYTTMLFFSQMLQPPHQKSGKRTFWAIFWVGLGGLLGWPFAAAVGLPFALEELLIHSSTHSRKKTVRFRDWRRTRFIRLMATSIMVLVKVLVPIVVIDRYYYKKLTVVPLNIVLYNVFGGDVGPNIFGTEPWWFYLINGLLNFNILFPAALLAAPVTIITSMVIPDDLPNPPSGEGYSLREPVLWFMLKFSPVYLWAAIFTAQPHKEERFLFVIYPLICFNAVVTLFMFQKLVQRGLENYGCRPKAAIHKYSTGLVWIILVASAAVSLSRILALYEHYGAPIEVYRKGFDLIKVPTTLIIEGSGTTILPDPSSSPIPSSASSPSGDSLSAGSLSKTPEVIRVCVGKEWYRFPSHYFLPEGAKLGLLKSHFDGLLPGEFQEMAVDADVLPEEKKPLSARGKDYRPVRFDWRWSAERRPGTWSAPKSMNNQNKEAPEHYTPLDKCHYLVDLDYGGRYADNQNESEDLVEPRYLQDKEHWERLYCKKFLDTQVGAGSNRWIRAFWIPNKITVALTRGQTKVWGDYCIARRKPEKDMSQGSSVTG
ncbi:MAG: Alg9-like mannosyltransferase family-domain-containing protein [Benniella sp.]|nr:MAG: Alg9-like mannosyltransferase family-domain-containing protein [Benniella sp.]